jgi:broad specificity phosphatase PhoE
MSTIVLIRHGETGMAGRFCGHSDPDLNASGEREAIRVAEEASRLGIERIYSSDLCRASQTAAAIVQRTGIEVDYLAGLREIYFGQWEGLAWHQIEARFPDEAGRWLREFPWRSAPGGETYAAFTARVETEITGLLREAADMTMAVVTHRGVMRHALTEFFGFTEAEAWTKTATYGATIVSRSANRLL